MGSSTDYGSQAGYGRVSSYGSCSSHNGYYDYYDREDDLDESDLLLGVAVVGIGVLSVALLAGFGIAKAIKALS